MAMMMPLEVATASAPPYMENTAVMGPMHSPVLDALGTLEERERIEADYEWFRYSKFALPFLIWNAALAATLLLLSWWYEGSDYTTWTDRNPRFYEVPSKTDDPEAGIPKPNKNVRIACFTVGLFGLVGLLVTMYAKPPPATRKLLYFFFSFVGLFISGVLGAIAGGMDAGKVNKAVWCRTRERGTVPLGNTNCYSMSKMAVAITVVDLGIAGSAIFTALLFVVTAVKAFAEPSDEEEQYPDSAAARGATRTTRECLLLLLFVVFVLYTLQFVFTIILSEGRDIRFADESFYVRTYNNKQPGWPIKNSRLRDSACSIIVGMSILNLIPFRSRVFAYVCAFVYWVGGSLLLVSFALDVKALDTERRRTCPVNWTCTFGSFIIVCILDAWVPLSVFMYIIFEFIARLLMECRHCTRNYGMFELKKHEQSECSCRPVRCEVCAKQMAAKDFVYSHRFECGYNTRRCEQCGVLVQEQHVSQHKSECPCWPVECPLCYMAFARDQLPAHTAACPMSPVLCDACGETVTKEMFSQHTTVCAEQQVTCAHCSVVMPKYQHDAHRLTCH